MAIPGLKVERILAVSASAGLAVGPRALESLACFGELFLRWNEKVNLGGRIDAEELVDRHFLDAFAAAGSLGGAKSLIDVGSGGGLPAIPLAILLPLARFDLYEPTGKKVSFLRTAVRELGLGGRVTVHAQRIEQGALPPDRTDVALSRATFAPADWLSLGTLLVRAGGTVVVFGTDENRAGCPVPLREISYAPNRRLLIYESSAA